MSNILITGVSSGIGYEVYKLFNHKKYQCYGIDKKFSNIPNLQILDVTDFNDISICFNKLRIKHIKFDVIVPCAVYQNKVSFNDLTINDFNKTITTNIDGIFNVLKLAFEMKLMNKNCKIIIPTSIHHSKPRVNHLAYDVSKAAVTMLIKELAIELAAYHITINGVSFGAVRTPLNGNWLNNKEECKKVLLKVPMKKILEPKDIALFIYDMTTDVFKYCTGSIYEIDGGRHLL